MQNSFLLFYLLLLLPTFAMSQSSAVLDAAYVSNMSGSRNYVKNPNAEYNACSVSGCGSGTVVASNVTIARSTTTPLHAGTEFNLTSTSTPWFATWSVNPVDAGLPTRQCEVRATVRGTVAGTTYLKFLDGVTELYTENITVSATDPKRFGGVFNCGALSGTLTVKIGSSGATTGALEVGNVYFGEWFSPLSQVAGPVSSTDNALVRFDGTTGKIIQDYSATPVTSDDNGILAVPNTTDATGAAGGAVRVTGGLDVAKKIFANTSVTTPIVSADTHQTKTASGSMTFKNQGGDTIGTWADSGAFDFGKAGMTANHIIRSAGGVQMRNNNSQGISIIPTATGYSSAIESGTNDLEVRSGTSGKGVKLMGDTGTNYVIAELGLLKFTASMATTTSVSSNAYIDSADGERLLRITSSKRYKNNILPDVSAKIVYEARPVSYNSKLDHDDKNKRFIGLIAEEVEKIDKNYVYYNQEGQVEGVNYLMITMPLIKAVQEQKAQIDTLKTAVVCLSNADTKQEKQECVRNIGK